MTEMTNKGPDMQRKGSRGDRLTGRRRSSISGSRKASLVITPDTIPQFVIPTLSPPINQRRASDSSAYPSDMLAVESMIHQRHHSFTEALLRHDEASIWPAFAPLVMAAEQCRKSRKESTDDESESLQSNELQVPFTKERSSSDASSRYLMPPNWDSLGDSRKATSDPGFQLSMTLGHLTTVCTPYGFPILSQMPRTDRKESLLLSCPRTSRNTSSSSTPTPSDNKPDSNNNSMNNKVTTEARRRFVRQMTNDSSVSSSVSTSSAASEIWEDSDHRSVSELSSSTDSDHVGEPRSTASSPDTSPTVSPSRRERFRRCHTITGTTPPSFRRKRLSSTSKEDRAQTLQHLHLHCARQGQGKDYGEIHMSLNYDRIFKLLKVNILRCENIGRSEGAAPDEVSSYAKIYFMPGKRQPQQTRLVKNTCDPEFNEMFYFKNISPTDLRTGQLRVKLNRSKRSGMGEAWIPLVQIEQHLVMLIREDLKPKSRSEVRLICFS